MAILNVYAGGMNKNAGGGYSTDETVIGTWIDGKPLYRKVFQFTTPSNLSGSGTSIAVMNWDSDMNILVHGYGVLTTQDEQQIPIPYAAGTNDFLAIIYNPPTAICEPNTIRCAGSSNYASKGVFFVFEYTKITDLSDIIWWSPKMTSNNVPAPFSASASSVLTDSTSAWNAFDNNANTYWHSTSTDSNPWIMFDFGQRTYTRGVRLTARTYNGTPQIFPYHGTVEGSNDGEHWTEIKSFSDLANLDNGRTEEVLFSNPAVFRYYRISNMGAGYVGFAELEFLVRI